MRRLVNRRTAALALVVVLAAGCAAGSPGRSSLEMIGRGLVGLVLSPLMIIGGVAQGLAFLPYTVGSAATDLNRALIDAQAVSLDSAYVATYGVSLADPRVDGHTGRIAEESGYGRHRPDAMLDATRAFQRLLASQGMPEDTARHYVLGGVYTHVRSRGHILLSVAYRHPGMELFRARSKHTAIVTTFRPEHMGWREPYERDVRGQVVDEVIDWVAMDYAALRQDKVVAMLMVLAAEAVKSEKRSPDYWAIESRWLTGDTERVIHESAARVKLDGMPRAMR
jgi:hypothetical protein